MTKKQHVEQGERLKKIRNHLRFNQEKMADLLGVTQPQLSRLEKGEYAISIEMLAVIIELGYSINWLVKEVGPMKIAQVEEGLPLAADSSDIKYQQERDRRLAELEAFIREKFPDFNR